MFHFPSVVQQVVRKAVLDDVTKAGNDGGLKSFEQVLSCVFVHMWLYLHVCWHACVSLFVCTCMCVNTVHVFVQNVCVC